MNLTKIRLLILEYSIKRASSVEEHDRYMEIERLAYSASCHFVKSNMIHIPQICFLDKNYMRCFRLCFNEFLLERDVKFFL